LAPADDQIETLYWIAIILGLVEGITEFLPISSTGHLIVAGAFLGFTGEKAKVFEIVIQTGAMLAVVWEYRHRFTSLTQSMHKDREARRFVINLVVAFFPAALLGVLAGDAIKAYLFNPATVALALIVGGLVILWAERRRHQIRVERVDDVTWREALTIGCAQCFALVPGTSRAAATIIGGLFTGLSRRAATEFSFFLAVPTLLGAGVYDLLKNRELLASSDLGWFAAGAVISFVSALASVRWLLRFISTHDFAAFAVYRIVFGILLLGLIRFGWLAA
jgi:undecaprenyl-diphosphatase